MTQAQEMVGLLHPPFLLGVHVEAVTAWDCSLTLVISQKFPAAVCDTSVPHGLG